MSRCLAFRAHRPAQCSQFRLPLRLRFLRQGLQDYEYLRLLEKLGAREEARHIAKELCPEADVWVQDRDHEKLAAAREKMARTIEALTRRKRGGPKSPATVPPR